MNLRFRAGRVAALAMSILFFTFATAANGAESSVVKFEKHLKPILAKHCVRCHGAKKHEGDIRLDKLNPDLLSGKDADHWHEVLNQINEGGMPPKGERQLSKLELATITTWLEVELKKAADLRNSTGSRQLMRRMNRYEYQYTLQDLLGVSLDYSANVPGDLSGEDGLETNATLLGMSPVLMQSYLEVADLALEEAIPDGPEKVFKKTISKLSVTTIRGQRKKGNGKGKGNVKGNPVKPSIIAPSPGFRQTNFAHDLPRKVTFTERPFAGRFVVRILVKGTAASDGRLPELTAHVGHRASGDYDPKKIIGRQIVKPTGEPLTVEFVGNIEDFPLGKKNAYYNGSGSHDVTHLSVWLWNTTRPKSQYTPDTNIADIDEPLLEVHSVEFEGPLLAGYPSETAKNLLPESGTPDNEDASARKVLSTFMRRVFRRDVADSEVAHAVDSFHGFRQLTGDFKSAMRKTMAMLLISPRFIYLVEPLPPTESARRLNSYELATRLSYFLWASMPDDELLTLAASGQLLKPEMLKKQVHRMRRDAKFQRFVKHFSSQWLGLSAMDHVAVNPKAYPQFSDEIRANLKRETLAFASYVFSNDLSCRNFVSSNFATLNNVVARYYGIEGVYGSHFRPVSLTPDKHRGGILTQGSVMIMGSDGTESNPIYRGVWLRKRLFADPPPPPPPGAPPLEKKDSSQLSLKQQIELHRNSPACARCHSQIDPWGIAFEAYDATGQLKPVRTAAASFDDRSILPDGSVVKGMSELQAYLLKHKSAELANALVRRMSGYALGRKLEFSENEMVEELTTRFVRDDCRPSSLIEGIVTSTAFLTK